MLPLILVLRGVVFYVASVMNFFLAVRTISTGQAFVSLEGRSNNLIHSSIIII